MTNSVLTIQKLLRLLCNCPRLETFELARTEPLLLTGEVVAVSQTSASSGSDVQLLSNIDVDSPTLFIAELPRLRGLRMSYLNVEHALAILALLRLPKRLAMRLDHLKSSAPYARAAVAYPPWPSLTVPPISALYGVKGLTHLDIIHPGNEGSTMHLHLTSPGVDSGVWFHISVKGVYSLLEHLVLHLDTREITTFRLHIHCEAVKHLTFLRSLLVRMPSLSCLLVKCNHTRYVSSHPLASVPLPDQMEEALTPTPFSDGDVVDIPAPRLDTFGIEMACSKTPAVDALVRMTASRAQSGHPIRSLVSNISGTTQEDLASVSEFVEHLDVTSRPLLEISSGIPPAFRMKNDYWEVFRHGKGMEGWILD